MSARSRAEQGYSGAYGGSLKTRKSAGTPWPRRQTFRERSSERQPHAQTVWVRKRGVEGLDVEGCQIGEPLGLLLIDTSPVDSTVHIERRPADPVADRRAC